MAIKKILTLPNDEKLLRKKSKPVLRVTKRVRRLVDDLMDTLDDANGVGLAAPQIGIRKRVAIVAIGLTPTGEWADSEEEPFYLPLIDPKIIEEGKWQRDYDGCLSVHGLQGYTERPNTLRIHTLDLENNLMEYEFEGFNARIVHHEIDHLDGILYFDRLTGLDELYYLVESQEDPDKVEFLPYLNVHPQFRLMSWRRKNLPVNGVKTIMD